MNTNTVFIVAAIVIVTIATVVVLAAAMFWPRPVDVENPAPASPISKPPAQLPPIDAIPVAEPIPPAKASPSPAPNQEAASQPPAPSQPEVEPTDAKLVARVKRVLFADEIGDEQFQDMEALIRNGQAARDAILSVLRNKSLRQKLLTPPTKNPEGDLPLQRGCRMLEVRPGEDVVEALTPFLDVESHEARASLAYVLGKTGSPGILMHFDRLVQDESSSVGLFLSNGIVEAIEERRMNEAAKAALYDRVLDLLKNGDASNWTPELLFALNDRKATEYLRSDEVLSLDYKNLQPVLGFNVGYRVSPPRERLLLLIDQLDARQRDYRASALLDRCLSWLEGMKNPEDRARFEKYLTDPDGNIVLVASQALLISHQISGYDSRLHLKAEKEGFAALTPAQQHYLALTELSREVADGGFRQYLETAAGDHWRVALAGLNAIQCQDRARVLREVLAKFPNQMPDENEARRKKQLADLSNADEKLFEELVDYDDQFMNSNEKLEGYLTRYILKHLQDFKD